MSLGASTLLGILSPYNRGTERETPGLRRSGGGGEGGEKTCAPARSLSIFPISFFIGLSCVLYSAISHEPVSFSRRAASFYFFPHPFPSRPVRALSHRGTTYKLTERLHAKLSGETLATDNRYRGFPLPKIEYFFPLSPPARKRKREKARESERNFSNLLTAPSPFPSPLSLPLSLSLPISRSSHFPRRPPSFLIFYCSSFVAPAQLSPLYLREEFLATLSFSTLSSSRSV